MQFSIFIILFNFYIQCIICCCYASYKLIHIDSIFNNNYLTMDKKQISRLDKLNCIVFPMVYGMGSKRNEDAQQLFNLMVKYAENKQECILKKGKDRKMVKDHLTKASPESEDGFSSLAIKFLCDYGSAIILTKDKEHSPINIQIVSLEQWATGANDWKASKLELINPGGQSSLFAPTVSMHSQSLPTFLSSFDQKLTRSFSLISNRNSQRSQSHSAQYSPQQIQQACKLALKIGYYPTPYDNQEKSKQESSDKQKNSAETIGQKISLSSSDADTAWYVAKAIVTKLIGTSKQLKLFSQKFLIGFKGYLLKMATTQKAKNQDYCREEVEKYKLCLDQIINEYKQKISKQKGKIQRFSQLIDSIEKNIITIKGGKLTSSIEDKPNFYKKLDVQIKQQPIFVRHHEKQHQKQVIKEKQIDDFPIEVEKRFVFQELMDLYHKTDKQNQSDVNKWILLTQRVIWGLTRQLCNNKKVIDLSVHMRQIECEIGTSTMGSLVLAYEGIINKNKMYYGMQLQGQAESHIQLIRAITAVIAFQAVKINRQKRKSNLSEYKVPFDIDDLYNKFHSNSTDARKAMKLLKVYNSYRKKNKTPIFQLNQTSTTFHKFAKLVGQETRSAQAWKKGMDKLLQTQKQLQANKASYEQLQLTINTIQRYANNYQNDQYLRQWIISTLSSSSAVNIQSPCQYYPEGDPWLYAFLNNIPPDVLGMIKMLHLAQNSVKVDSFNEDNNLMFINSAFDYQQMPLKISAKRLTGTQNIQKPTANNITTVKPQPRAFIYCGNSIYCNNYDAVEFYKEIDKFSCEQQCTLTHIKQKMLQFLRPASDINMTRQHEVYASLHLKPTQIQLENYEAMCNVRSAEHTQLILLCSGILERKIIADSYDQKPLLAQRLILQTGGKISTYHKETEKHFKKGQKLIQQFMNVWVYSDTRFCPILAPLVTFLARQIVDDELVKGDEAKKLLNVYYELSKKCLEQFKRAEKELFQKPGQKIQWDQRYVCMAAICCFREVQLAEQDVEQIKFLLSMIFRARISKILSDRQERPAKKRIFETELQYSVEKAIFRNIGIVSNFIKDNYEQLGEIMKDIDNSFPNDVKWTQVNLFHFRGESEESKDIYQLNIYAGSIFKNGKQITCLDQKIKNNPYYVEIFGKDRQFQVFQSHYTDYLRTKDNLNYQFKINQKKGSAYLQFSEDGSVIRHIIKKSSVKFDEQIWTLLPRELIRSSKCHIPQIYIEKYLAWYSETRRCIVFRKAKFEEIYQIGMVVFIDSSNAQPGVIGASHIVYHGSYDNQNLDQICDQKNQLYEQVILRSKQQKLEYIQPFKFLSKFESTKFIIQLKSRKTNEIFYLLHRYLLKFKIVNETRLLSETYFGYALDYSYHSTKNNLFNQFPCLVLEKYQNSPTILNNHKRILLISDGKIQKCGTINKINDPLGHLRSYKYDIHDFFGDIRGSSRQSILHLAALMLSINDNIKIGSIEMTPLQYAMYLMRSCFTNRPLSKFQGEKLYNIIQLGSTQVMLLSEALWKMAKELGQILPFPSQNNDYKNRYWSFQKKFLQSRTLYENNYNNNITRFREKINKDILRFLGVKLHEGKKIQIQQSQSSSDQFQLENSYWYGFKKYTGQALNSSLQMIKYKYIQFQLQAKKLNVWNQKALKQASNTFPSELEELRKKHKNDEMMKEMIQQLSQSYRVYWKEQSRIVEIAEKITQDQKKKQIELIKMLKSKALEILKLIQASITQMKTENETHPDVITDYRPTLTPAMYTSILCEKDIILEYYPDLDKGVAKLLKETIKIWLELKTRTASFERTEQLLAQEKVDVVAVMREVLSPRSAVFQKNEWLCFQAQMKVQLWPSQLETYNNLMNGASSGSFCQLNMGEGKTQVIIPLIILNTIYTNSAKQGRSCLPRINLLSSLFQEARGNFFRFISATGFQIPAFEIPFNRKVKLVKNSINAIKHLIDSFSNKAYILMTRESRLSEILRFHEGKIISNNLSQNKQNQKKYILKDPSFKFDFNKKDSFQTLIQNDIFDIFDEIDALMYCKKSYIFSIGDQLDLANDMLRFEIIKLCLQIFLTKFFKQSLSQKIVVTDETNEDAIEMIHRGQFPIGLRLTLENISKAQVLQFRKKIAKQLVIQSQSYCPYYSFINSLKTEKQRQQLLQYIINPQANSKYLPTTIPQASRPQIYLLRGILAYGIFQHCLSMRCGVDYGAPNEYHIKKIAVPYEAADIPSKTSEYEQPDVSTLLSYVSYYTKGLSPKYFDDCLRSLLELSKTSKQIEYGQWVDILDAEEKEIFELKSVQSINYNSKSHRELLYSVFRKNRKTIAFWLTKCVFLKDLKQFAKSICASAWDLADVKRSVGFSGTKDNRWLYSNLLNWKPCQTPEILGTDGKMIHLITKFTNEVALIEENNKTLWQRFVDLALDKKVGCIIDAGAICVGKSLRDEIVPWIAEHQKFDSNRFLGISFCDNNGRWFVYDIEGKFYIPRGTTIPDHQTFVVFDQARTRGADLKMDGDIVAALSLGPELTKDSLMQAAGRLRKLGRNQSLIIMATHEVFSHLDNFPKDVNVYKQHIAQSNSKDKQKLPKSIIAWCCQNSIKDNHDLLMQFAELGWKYIHSKVKKQAFQQELTTNLQIMYSQPIQFASVTQLGQRAQKTKDKELVNHASGKFICQILNKYGKTVIKQAGTLDDVCERQVQAQKEKEKEQENGLTAMHPIPQVEKPNILTTVPDNQFVFDSKFKMTANLIETTNSLAANNKKEIPQLYFIKVKEDELLAVSIREASRFIETSIIKKQGAEPYQIFMLNSLQLESEIIKKFKVEGAFISAKFLAGVENYSPKEENILLGQLILSAKVKKQWSENYNTLVAIFLRLKRMYLKKFKGSTLERLITRLHNQA